MKTKTILLIVGAVFAVLFLRGWSKAATAVDAALGAGEWKKARLSFKLQAAAQNMLG